jgi:hypothetical protein
MEQMKNLLKNNYNSIIIEKPIMGNFISHINDYASEWNISDSEYYTWCFSEDGNMAFCVCKKDCHEEQEEILNLTTVFLHNSEILFKLNIIESEVENTSFYTVEDKKKYLKINENTFAKIPQNAELTISLKLKNGKIGDIMAVIENIQCLTKYNEQVKISLSSFVNLISNAIKAQ